MATRTWINEDCNRSVENGHERVLGPYKRRGHVLHDAASVEHWFDDETLPSAVARAKSKRRASRETDPLLSTVESADFPETEPTAPAPLRQLITRPVLIAVLNHAFLDFCSMPYDALLPLVYATPIGLGGLGLTPYSIGLLMGLCGISNAFVQGLFGGRIIRYVGLRRIYTGFFAARAGSVDGTVIAILAVQLNSSFFVYLGYPHGLNFDTKRATTILFIIDSAPDKANIGSVNGLVQMVGTILRAVAPSFASSLFALSIKNNLAGGYLVYIILRAEDEISMKWWWWIAWDLPWDLAMDMVEERGRAVDPYRADRSGGDEILYTQQILVLVGDLSVQLASAWRTLRSLDAENDLDVEPRRA
ncbi:hypothetical protein B0H11DRAFT_1920245 [Mycena galericulata]|nr:hypothetical protein B0H11DRAFT_1920245 [Mycena galericulata]